MRDAIEAGWAAASADHPGATAERRFPEHDSVTLFLALALHSAGRSDQAVARLITLALDRIKADDLAHYHRVLRQYASDLLPDASQSPAEPSGRPAWPAWPARP
jgi:hypothetical protein